MSDDDTSMNLHEQIQRCKDAIDSAVGEHRRRVDICQSCDSLHEKYLYCTECKCPLILKASWPQQTCPLNKWEVTE